MKKNIIVNIITVSRVVILIPIFLSVNLNYLIFATIWAGLSDLIDGFLARKWGVSTALGRLLDQYADKIASLLLFVFFLQSKQISYFFAALIVSREILVIIFRKLKWSDENSNFIGKAKTFFVYVLFIFLSISDRIPNFFIDFRIIFSVLVITCSWLSLFMSITNLAPQLIYVFGTTGLSAVKIKKAPGTVSSLAAFLIFFIFFKSVVFEYKISVLLILLIFHYSYFNFFLARVKYLRDDPSIYTLDETLAIAMSWLFLGELSLIEAIILFLLFRLFDILKPLGIRKIEKQVN